MKRFTANAIVPLLGLTLAGLAAQSACAQVFGSNGNAGIYVQGNGQAMAGTFDENGFRGITAGPDGRVRRLDGHAPTINPFSATKPDSRSGFRQPVDSGAFAGAMSGRTDIGPGGFDPFAFVFGNSRPTSGAGVVVGGMPNRDLAAATRMFRQERYEEALRLADRAHRTNPNDLQAGQVKSLSLFALQKYDRSAAAAYEVLEADGAWDWASLRQMYRDTETYLQQLRALQDSTRPVASAASMFLLAYHYLMLDKVDEARDALEKTKSLQPENSLVDELLASLPPVIDKR